MYTCTVCDVCVMCVMCVGASVSSSGQAQWLKAPIVVETGQDNSFQGRSHRDYQRCVYLTLSDLVPSCC